MSNKIMIAMVGAPGCGKSTLVDELATEYDLDVVCPDTIRGELFGDEGCQEKGWLVFKIAYERLEEFLLSSDSNGVGSNDTTYRDNPHQ